MDRIMMKSVYSAKQWPTTNKSSHIQENGRFKYPQNIVDIRKHIS